MYIRFLISNTFISNARWTLAKNQANAKQHPEAEHVLFENFHILHPHYHPNIIGHTLKNKQENKCVYIHTINHNENEDENEK